MRRMIAYLLAISMMLVRFTGDAYAEATTKPSEGLSYEELLRYAEELFGFEDTRYYPYLPTFLDPVNYYGYLSMHGGVKDDIYYVVYNGHSEENVTAYLGFLEYWGYVGEPADSGLSGVQAWRMTSGTSQHEGRPLMQKVDVYYVTEHGLLVVAYSYLDAWLYDEWLACPDWQIYDHFEPGMLPCILPLNDDVTITVEEVFLTDLLFVTAGKELSLYPYEASMLEELDLHITALEAPDGSFTQYALHMESDDSQTNRQMLCVRLSCNYGAREKLLHSLRAASVEADEGYSEYADCTDVPMLTLTQSEDDPLVFSVAEVGESTDLWLVFPPGVYDAWEVRRLYFCLQDETAPWIGDLRNWKYVNFQLVPSLFR